LLELVRNHLPLLRERIEDVPLLANRFLRGFTMAYGRSSKELTPGAYAVLQEHRWLGDVRELRNLMERIVIVNPQVRVDARHLAEQRKRDLSRAPGPRLRRASGSLKRDNRNGGFRERFSRSGSD
jgi:two-component system nitrogen regulation response regulator NtrX